MIISRTDIVSKLFLRFSSEFKSREFQYICMALVDTIVERLMSRYPIIIDNFGTLVPSIRKDSAPTYIKRRKKEVPLYRLQVKFIPNARLMAFIQNPQNLALLKRRICLKSMDLFQKTQRKSLKAKNRWYGVKKLELIPAEENLEAFMLEDDADLEECDTEPKDKDDVDKDTTIE